MKTVFLIFILMSGILTVQPTIARMQVLKPGEVAIAHSPSKFASVISMGQIETINFDTKRVRINGVSYSFDSATRFFDRANHKSQATQLKAGDWINFWIKSSSTQTTPALEQVTLLGKT